MLSKIWRQHRCRSSVIKAQKYLVLVSLYVRIRKKKFGKNKNKLKDLNICMLGYKVNLSGLLYMTYMIYISYFMPLWLLDQLCLLNTKLLNI